MLLTQDHQPNAHSYYKRRTSLQTSKMHIITAKAALLEDTEQDLLRVKTTTTRQKNSLPRRGEKNNTNNNNNIFSKMHTSWKHLKLQRGRKEKGSRKRTTKAVLKD